MLESVTAQTDIDGCGDKDDPLCLYVEEEEGVEVELEEVVERGGLEGEGQAPQPASD